VGALFRFVLAEPLDKVKVVMQEGIFFHDGGRRRIFLHLLLGDPIQTIQCPFGHVQNHCPEPGERIGMMVILANFLLGRWNQF
jgi:hypothetical protein